MSPSFLLTLKQQALSLVLHNRHLLLLLLSILLLGVCYVDKLVSFEYFLVQVGLVLQEVGNIDYFLVEKHASNLT